MTTKQMVLNKPRFVNASLFDFCRAENCLLICDLLDPYNYCYVSQSLFTLVELFMIYLQSWLWEPRMQVFPFLRVFDHRKRRWRSCWRTRQSWWVTTSLYNTQSSANRSRVDWTELEISLINKMNRTGLKTEPWRTPDEERTPLIETFCVWLDRKALIRLSILPLIP